MIELFCSSETYRDADPAYFPIRKWIETTLGKSISKIDSGTRSAVVEFIPSIMPPDIAVKYDEILKVRRKKTNSSFGRRSTMLNSWRSRKRIAKSLS